MKSYHNIENIHFSGEFMILTIDGEEKRVILKDVSTILDRASEKERSTFEVSPSGYGIHWPLIDEDVAIDGLIGIVHTRELRRKTA
jgi:hypothetical protein